MATVYPDAELAARDWAPSNQLVVRAYDAWHTGLDRALDELPEMPTCPHALFRKLATSRLPVRKRFALVLDAGTPVALAGLRQEDRHWRPMGEEIAPRAIVPARDGYLFPALDALGLDIWVSFYEATPPDAWTRSAHAVPRFAMPCDMDFERYWHETGLWGVVKWSRRMTRDFTLEVDAPGAAADNIQRTIERWAADSGSQEKIKADLLLAAAHYEGSGHYRTFRLLDGDKPIAGHNFFVDGDRLSFQSTWYDSEYRKCSPGTRLMDLVMFWARDAGYREVDLGGAHAYKATWAPNGGELWSFNVCPERTYHVKRFARLAARGAAKARSLPMRSLWRRDG